MGWNKLQQTGNVMQTDFEEQQKKNAGFGA